MEMWKINLKFNVGEDHLAHHACATPTLARLNKSVKLIPFIGGRSGDEKSVAGSEGYHQGIKNYIVLHHQGIKKYIVLQFREGE